MHSNFYQFDFELPNQEESDKLIAMLAEQGFDGFVEEEDLLIAFIPEFQFNQDAFEKVLEKFSIVSYTKSDIENINWNKKWESEFEPVFVDKFVAIRAHFHQPIKNVQHEIVITPKMSFGTGHHATTYLVMKHMESVNFKDKTVFDFGTGTGILAILAQKLGAASVFAIDNDEWSITNTEENIEQNGCKHIQVALMETIPAGKQYDIILANINLNVITASLDSISAIAHAGTEAIFSGFLATDEKAMKTAIEKAGFQHLSVTQKGDWIAILTKKI
ncbi:MAG: 50S ribosomal protein L11 methyltransferase [Chitinophagaceae bacterium]|nr:50S ribosomal protein L11 methyltransferase [Chitinophagaceae bacterium]